MIDQALILAGGLGMRLRPLTDDVAKPMIDIGGRPFLAYLVEQLVSWKFKKIVMLLGYKSETIIDYFNNGAKFGIEISYSILSSDAETGLRVKAATEMIESTFMLMYCDNFINLHFPTMEQNFVQRKKIAQIAVYRNRDGFTRDNLRVGQDGLVEIYDKSSTSPNLSGVDLGFLIANEKILEYLPDENKSFEESVYPALISERELAAFETEQRYYSIGSLDRLAETERFLGDYAG